MRLKSSGELYDTLVTDESGYAISKKLPIGTYTVKQIEGREGTEYVEPFDVTIEFSQSDIDNGVEYKLYSYKFPDNPLYNAYIYGKIKVIKIDATTQEVIKKAGVTFMIRPTEDIVVCGVVKYEKDKFIEINGVNEFVTNDEGIIEMRDVEENQNGCALYQTQRAGSCNNKPRRTSRGRRISPYGNREQRSSRPNHPS